ncbi:protein kinase, partial [Coemansia sp. 'formosensis']
CPGPRGNRRPLDVHFRYIQWLIEVFPQAAGHQAVIRVVERPIRLFREQERYRNDPRYLKMWVWYCGLIYEGQEAVFQHLLAQRIGDSLALLYEEYGKLLEGRGNVRKADEVYQLGIARKAQPLARLERRYEEFQRRVMANAMRKEKEPAAEPPEAENAQRTMLGTKRTGASVRSAPANTLPSSQRGVASDGVRVNSRIAVYTDPEGTASASKGPPTTWRDVGSDEGRRKENLREASTWRGQTLEQCRVHPPAEKFTVFSDDAPAPPPHQGSMQGSALGAKSADTASGLLQSFDDARATKSKARAVERMVMPDWILFPAGDGVPQCAEEARARLPRYHFDYDAWVAAQKHESPRAARRRSVVGGNSPTINTRAAEQGMLELWNDLSDSDSESLLGPGDHPPRTPKPSDRPQSSGGLTDDDYQFTMGPVVPNIVPEELAHRPPVIPTSARVVRRQDPIAGDDDMPTTVLNSIRAAKRQEMRLGRGPAGPTPLAMRTQTPVMARGLRSIGEEPLDASEEEYHPPPLQFAYAAKPASLHHHSTPARSSAQHHSTPARGSVQRPPAGSCAGRHTPGYTRTTGFSVSGAELTGLSGFTGVSTIGGPTSLLTTGQYASDDEHSESLEQPHGLAPTPLRKRLSMAAKDFGNMTPRFPKSLPTEDDQGDVHSSPDDDDDDVEDEDDGDEPCTENIGEFADLDSQMNELEMQLGTKFKSRHDDASPFRVFSDDAKSPRTRSPPVKKPAPMFTIFKD